MTLTQLIILGLATYRVSLLFSSERGPGKLFLRLRQWIKREAKQHPALKKTDLHEGIECPLCLSITFGAVIILLFQYQPQMPEPLKTGTSLLIYMLAVSGLAVCLHRLFTKNLKK